MDVYTSELGALYTGDPSWFAWHSSTLPTRKRERVVSGFGTLELHFNFFSQHRNQVITGAAQRSRGTYNFTFGKAEQRHPPNHNHPCCHRGKPVPAASSTVAAHSSPSPGCWLSLSALSLEAAAPGQLCREGSHQPPPTHPNLLASLTRATRLLEPRADESDGNAPTDRC